MSDTGKPIKEAELTAFERWELPLIDEAGNQVRETEVKPLTAEDLEVIRQEAHAAGMEEGFAEGRQAGYKDGYEHGEAEGRAAGTAAGQQEGRAQAITDTTAERNAVLQRLKAILQALLEPMGQHEDELEQAMLNIVLATARAVLWREVVLDSSQIGRVIHEAIDALPEERDRIRLHLNECDLTEAESIIREMDAEAVCQADNDVLPGGCKVETRHSLVDFTIDKRFQKVVQTLLDNASRPSEVKDVPGLEESLTDLTDLHRTVLDEPLTDAPSARADDSNKDSDGNDSNESPSL